jgi:hypothetical protein
MTRAGMLALVEFVKKEAHTLRWAEGVILWLDLP